MVDFKKHLGKKITEKQIEPTLIYDRLDRAVDKGPLRKPQEYILNEWFLNRRQKKDVVIKLHTGQGKTLIGLLILQSKLNEGIAPALYLCPNKLLVEQTCEQARQFGIQTVTAEDDLPPEFFEGTAILVATVNKLFNGKTKFNLGPRSIKTGVVLLDDSHACVDSIRDAVSVKLDNEHPVYKSLLGLFASDLEHQGSGTFEDIKTGKHDALLAIPYWAWKDKSSEVISILSKHSDSKGLQFLWPILRDRIRECACYISGTSLEIVPHLAPLDLFGTYWDARHRIFMSATVTNDAFLVKGLRLDRYAIETPLTFPSEKWSGEKMILVPALIDESLNRTEMVHMFSQPQQNRKHGVTILAPSFPRTIDWEKSGAAVARKETIDVFIRNLRGGIRHQTVVLVNRYDGIDLPDDACRVLVFDSLPQGENLSDKYVEFTRPGSDLLNIRLARSIEQGLGRSVRGEKDYSVIVIVGPELVRFLRQPNTRAFLSDQTKKQVEIGHDISDLAQEEVRKGANPTQAFNGLILQCLKRDDGWKEYYIDQMNSIVSTPTVARGLDLFEAELKAETLYYQMHNPDAAIQVLQGLVDGGGLVDAEKGHYLQEMARIKYDTQLVESNKLQISAHTKNRFLLLPKSGSHVYKLRPLPGARIANIIKWVRGFEDYEQLKIAIDDIIERLDFGVRSENFESGFQELGTALGFSSERPDREWKTGPDNLWCLAENDYLLVECKSEVELDRAEIHRSETGQMNNALGWFHEEYPGCRCARIMIIPANKLGNGACFNEEVSIMRKTELNKLKKAVGGFFNEFRAQEFNSLSESSIHEWLSAHKLVADDIKSVYQKGIFQGAK